MKNQLREIVTIVSIGVFALFFILVQSCNNSSQTPQNANTWIKLTPEQKADSIKKVRQAAFVQQHYNDSLIRANEIKDSIAEANKSDWNYSEEDDEMTSKKIYFATITCPDEIDFDFPYNGGSTAYLTIRKKSNGTNVYLHLSKCQFMSNVVNGENIRIRFDEQQPQTYSCSMPSDGSSTTLFINAASSVIARLKKAKNIIIEAEFYREGARKMKFAVKNLTWNH